MKSLFAALLIALSVSAAAGGCAAGQSTSRVSAQAASSVPGGCPNGEMAGCNKGMWSLNMHGVALIASLEQAATYRICLDAVSKGSIILEIDDESMYDNQTGSYPEVVPAANVDEVVNLPCTLVTGKKIVVRASNILNPQPAFGHYERLETENPLKRLFAFNLQALPNNDLSALLAATANPRLFRVCIAPLEYTQARAEGRRHIKTDKGFLLADTSVPRGFPFSNRTCVDIEAKRVFLYGAHPAVNERISGFVAY